VNQRLFAELEAKMSGSLGEPSSLDAGMIKVQPSQAHLHLTQANIDHSGLRSDCALEPALLAPIRSILDKSRVANSQVTAE
jgi:hypothetical protein